MRIIILFLFLCCYQSNLLSQVAGNEVESVEEIDFEKRKIQQLKRIRIELINLNSKINTLKRNLENDLDTFEKIQSETKLANLESDYERKKFQFIEIATNINLAIKKTSKKETDFLEDVKQILAPALNSIKKISEKPRQIQELTEKASNIEERYNGAIEAREKINKLFKNGKDKTLNARLKASISMLDRLIKDLKVELEKIQFKIIKSEKNERSIVSTFSGLIFEFFKTKGKNLFLAFIVFISFFWFFKIGKNKLISIIDVRINKSDNKETYEWVLRPVKVIYNTVTTILAFFFAILTLYVLNDWVLVTLIIFVLVALIWSSKQYLPLFLEQSKIVLNLGAIRENERLMYQGLPWRIKSLGYYCKLSNPVLSGGELRVNTRELLSFNSRRSSSSEPWFPTKKGDWIEVNSIFGEVITQSPEQVIIRELGGEKRYFKSSDFYSLGIRNLNQGFSVEINFGVDYSHQKKLFDEVIPNLKNDFMAEIYNKHSDLKSSFKELSVEFISAGASSLDLRFFLKCNGDIASKKKFLSRSANAVFVNLCNKYDYIIPFNQLTVHMNE